MLYSVELYDSFLYLQDLTSADPYGILAIMYCVLMFIQQRMMPMGMDPAQQQILLMPLIFGVFMFTFPRDWYCIFHEHLADHLPTMVDSLVR